MKSRSKKLITAGVGVIVVGLLLFFYFNIGNPEWKCYRNYYVPYSDEMISAAEKVYATESYKKAIFPLHELEMKTPYFVSMGMVSETCILSDEEAEELIDLYIKDVADLTMKQTLQEAPDWLAEDISNLNIFFTTTVVLSSGFNRERKLDYF